MVKSNSSELDFYKTRGTVLCLTAAFPFPQNLSWSDSELSPCPNGHSPSRIPPLRDRRGSFSCIILSQVLYCFIYHLTERSAVECVGLWASDSSQKETLNTIHGRSAPFFTDTTEKTVSVGNGIAPRAFGMAVFLRPFSLAHERMVLL